LARCSNITPQSGDTSANLMSNLAIQALVSGVMLGLIYGLIGSSLSLLYGAMRIVNVAHGEFVIAGSYLTLILYQAFRLHPLLAIPLSFALFFLVGVALYYLLIPRLSRSDDPETASFLALYGLSLVAVSALVLAFDADTRSLNFSFEPIAVRVRGISFPTARLIALGADIVIVGGLVWLLFGTLHGKALRAIIMNREAVQMVGINLHGLSAIAYGLGAGIAAMTGVLTALVFPAFGPFGGLDYTLIGFTVIVLGGLANPTGALAAGVALGVTQQMATVFMPQSLSPAIGFILLITAVMIRSSLSQERL
jgi:branched-chain amino acid transport system permease protein